MAAWVKQYAVIFFLGFSAFLIALGFGSLGGSFWSNNIFLVILRNSGIAFMLGGLVLWAMYNRLRAGKSEINPIFGFMVAIGCLSGVVALLFPTIAFSWLLGLVALGVNAGALIIVVFLMILSPAYPEPLAVAWPGGPARYPGPDAAKALQESAHEHPDQLHGSEMAGDDLTIVEGIGPGIQEILYRVGIRRYADLAGQTPEQLKLTLRSNGFTAPIVATSWPAQAALAAQANWEALTDLQQALTAGRTGQ